MYQTASSHINKYDLIKIIIKVYKLNINLTKYFKFKLNGSLNDKKKITKYHHIIWNIMIEDFKEKYDKQMNISK